jgi:hypothetical protein
MNAENNIRKYELAGEGQGLFMLDQSFQSRVYTAPSLVLD